jgi:8-oxo-dGTP diphosphatase
MDIAAGIVRRGDELLMVLQAGPGEEPFWSVPGGRIEPGELATEGLVREVREETGLTVVDPGRLAFVVQQDERHENYFATVWVFDTEAVEGAIQVDDPDGFVREAAWIPLQEAISHLAQIRWQPLTVRYLRGEIEPGSAWLRRMHADGREQLIGPI